MWFGKITKALEQTSYQVQYFDRLMNNKKSAAIRWYTFDEEGPQETVQEEAVLGKVNLVQKNCPLHEVSCFSCND